jgi:hypothetical protein
MPNRPEPLSMNRTDTARYSRASSFTWNGSFRWATKAAG